MKISLYKTNVDDQSIINAEALGGRLAGICYMNGSIDDILEQNDETALKRAHLLIKSGHHSVFEHSNFTFIFEDMPKILAMILNNEKVYSTSEKSARYTEMDSNGPDGKLYFKWLDILKKNIRDKYSGILTSKQVEKLALENARYFLSVFAPTTVMAYTTNLRQLNYLLDYMENYIAINSNGDFNQHLIPILMEFCLLMAPYKVDGLTENKNVGLSLFAHRLRDCTWGDTFSTSYSGSFAQLAQAQRHRTLYYEMKILNQKSFYIPQIIQEDKSLVKEWSQDMAEIAHLYPQGMMVNINERGTLENFIRKCYERLCGQAQLEIMQQTRQTLHDYYEGTRTIKRFVANELLKYVDRPRCKFGYRCHRSCPWGPDNAFSRLV